MQISSGHERGRGSEQRGPTFTGTVWADPIMVAPGAPTMNVVTFPPGARTHWHMHEAGQILFVTHGRGLVAVEDGEAREIGPGDVVWFAPGEVHWHGGCPDTMVSHAAISLGTTSWQDAVTDAQYQAAMAAAGARQ